MHHRTNLIRITIPFASADYRVFVSAVRQLRRIMGCNAPDVLTLIQFNLQDRDATGIADDFLDAMRWPNSAGRVVLLKQLRKPRGSVPQHVCAHWPPQRKGGRAIPARPGDPSRN